MIVSIYVTTTAKAPKKHITGFAYVLETKTDKGPVTLSNKGRLEDHTKNLAELAAVVKALEHLRKPSDLIIYTTPYIASVINTWLHEWKANGWKNKSGKEVAEEYKHLEKLLESHRYEAKSEVNTYTQWLERTAEEEEKDVKNQHTRGAD